MTSALVASWTAYFKHAEQLIKKPPKDKDFPDQLKWHTKLFPQSLPHAALKRLVHDVQVTDMLEPGMQAQELACICAEPLNMQKTHC